MPKLTEAQLKQLKAVANEIADEETDGAFIVVIKGDYMRFLVTGPDVHTLAVLKATYIAEEQGYLIPVGQREMQAECPHNKDGRITH